MNRERIGILLPDLRGGGAEKVGVNLANGFAQRGYLVDMVLLQAEGVFLGDLDKSVRVVDLQAPRVRGAMFPLVRYLRQTKPQAVLASMWPLTVLAIWARRLARVETRVVVAEHTTWSRSELLERPTLDWQVRTSMRHVFPQAQGIVAVSQGAANDLAEFASLDRKSITAIYNPIVGADPSASDATLAPADWWNSEHPRVLAVGALKVVKDYPSLLKAFALLVQKTNAQLLILGEGECRAELEAQIMALGLGQNVFMPGFVLDPTPYFRRADLHVLSSTVEGFGNVIVEALAAGTPVVSTDCLSGPREILDDGRFGRLVPVGDELALAAAMGETLNSESDSEALKHRAQDFSIDKATDRYLELLFPDPDGLSGQLNKVPS